MVVVAMLAAIVSFAALGLVLGKAASDLVVTLARSAATRARHTR
jgi:hypothetical protein